MEIESKQLRQLFLIIPHEKKIDESNKVYLKNFCINAIHQGHNNLLFDLKNVDYLDSSALAVFISVIKLLDRTGQVILCELQPMVKILFEQTRLNRVFTIYDSLQEALEHSKSLIEEVLE